LGIRTPLVVPKTVKVLLTAPESQVFPVLGTTSDAVKHTWDSGVDSKTFTVFGTTSHAVKHTWDSGVETVLILRTVY
jgi:hypothetical protein